MQRFRPRWFHFLALLLLGTMAALGLSLGRRAGELIPSRTIVLKDFDELSGIAYYAAHDSLLAVNDEGHVAELDLDARILRSRRYPQFDFEDITLSQGDRVACLLDEQGQCLVEIDVATFDLIRTIALPDRPQSQNRGFEGVAAVSDSKFWLAHESSPAELVEFSDGALLPVTHLIGAFAITAVMLSEDRESVFVLSRERGLCRVHAKSGLQSRWRALAAPFAEGLTLVPGRGLYVALDRQPSKIVIFSKITNWNELQESLDRAR